MIVVKLMGGLANQMFQYAVGRAVAIANDTELRLDSSFYNHQPSEITQRHYALDVFNAAVKMADENDVAKMLGIWRFLPSRLSQAMNRRLPVDTYLFEKNANSYDGHIFDLGHDLYLDGYWQTDKYFVSIREIILNDFTLKADVSEVYRTFLRMIKTSQAVALHVRRGDYVTDKKTQEFAGNCRLDYYYESVELIKRKTDKPVFFIFSDDIAWCKDNLHISRQAHYVEGTKDYEDLMLMQFCQHNIIANSTFSWWGAWTNRNPEKIVIAPKRWFADENANKCDIVPESWIRI